MLHTQGSNQIREILTSYQPTIFKIELTNKSALKNNLVGLKIVEHVNDVLNLSFTKSWKGDILIHLMLMQCKNH